MKFFKQCWHGMLGAASILAMALTLGHHFAPQIIAFEMPQIAQGIRSNPNGALYSSALPLMANSLVYSARGIPAGPYMQSNGGPTSGNWHGGAKEFTLNLNQGGAAGTYTLATATNAAGGAGNGLGLQILRSTFWVNAAAAGGTAVTIQTNDTTVTTLMGSTATATMTGGKNLTPYLGTSYLGSGLAITFTTTGTFSAGTIVVALVYVGQVGQDICAGSATSC